MGKDTKHAHGENDSESTNHIIIMSIEVQTSSIWETSLSWPTLLTQNNGPQVK